MAQIRPIAAAASILVAGILQAHADVLVSSDATQNMTCSAGVCSPTAKNAVLNVSDLENLLASGSVTVTTTGSRGVHANDIRVTASFSWSAASSLTFDAYQSITIRQPVTVAGTGGLTVTTNDGGTKGIFSFGPRGSVTFESLTNPLAIDGVSFTLMNSLPALAAAVEENPRGAYALANSYDASQEGTYDASPINELDGRIEGLGNSISSSVKYSQAIELEPETGRTGESILPGFMGIDADSLQNGFVIP